MLPHHSILHDLFAWKTSRSSNNCGTHCIWILVSFQEFPVGHFCNRLISNGSLSNSCGGTYSLTWKWCGGFPVYVKADKNRFLRRHPIKDTWVCEILDNQNEKCSRAKGQNEYFASEVRDMSQGLWNSANNIHILCA